MTDVVAELAARAQSLAPEERSRLVELLLESLRESPLGEIEAAWAQEIERRVAAYERGEVETFAAEDVFAEARRIARKSTVVNGRIVLEGVALKEGAVVPVVTRGADERFSLTEAQEEELVEALAEIERGEFVSLDELLRSLPR